MMRHASLKTAPGTIATLCLCRLPLTALIFTIWLTCSFARHVPAAPQAGETNFNLEGKITEVHTGKLTVNTEGNILFHVTYNDQTEIKRSDGSRGTARDLKVGLRIKVEGHLTESGEVVGQKVALE